MSPAASSYLTTYGISTKQISMLLSGNISAARDKKLIEYVQCLFVPDHKTEALTILHECLFRPSPQLEVKAIADATPFESSDDLLTADEERYAVYDIDNFALNFGHYHAFQRLKAIADVSSRELFEFKLHPDTLVIEYRLMGQVLHTEALSKVLLEFELVRGEAFIVNFSSRLTLYFNKNKSEINARLTQRKQKQIEVLDQRTGTDTFAPLGVDYIKHAAELVPFMNVLTELAITTDELTDAVEQWEDSLGESGCQATLFILCFGIYKKELLQEQQTDEQTELYQALDTKRRTLHKGSIKQITGLLKALLQKSRRLPHARFNTRKPN